MPSEEPERDWRPVLHGLARTRGFNPACKRFWFLRHGESVGNADRIVQGQSCWGLSDTGIAQAEDVPEMLGDAPFKRIVASDLKRVRQTITPLLEARNIPAIATEGFRERGFGEFEGNHIQMNLWFATGKGTEPMAAFVERVLAAAEQHLTDDHTLIAAHGGVLHVLYGAMDVALEPWMRANAVPIMFSSAAGDGAWSFEAVRPKIETAISAVT